MKKIPGSQIFAYSMSGFGANFVFTLMSTYLMIFYTDNVGLAASVVGTLFLVARLWDAVLDPLVGLLVDRTNTKMGKFRPYLLIGGILTGALTIAVFFNPQTDLTGKIIYAFITYIVWGTAFGMMDVPFWSMGSAMTVDTNERTKIYSVLRVVAMIAIILSTVLTMPIVLAAGHGNNSQGYLTVSVIYGVICIVGGIVAAVFTRERVKVRPKAKEKFSDSFKIIFKNYPLLMVLLAFTFYNMGAVIKQAQATYFFTYSFHNIALFPVFVAVMAVPMIVAMIFSPAISKKFGKKRTLIWMGVTSAVLSAVSYFWIYNLTLLLVFNGVVAAALGIIIVLLTSLQADTIEYAEWKLGKRSESIIFSMCTFTMKLASALAGAFAGFYLTFVGYQPNVEQTPTAINGINMMMTWIPAACFAIMVVAVALFPITEKKHAEMVKELQDRKELEIVEDVAAAAGETKA